MAERSFSCGSATTFSTDIFTGISFAESTAAKRIVQAAVVLVSLYGIYAFIVRGFFKYLFYTQKFFFFDLERGIPLFLFDYLSIFVLIATVTLAVLKILRRARDLPRA